MAVEEREDHPYRQGLLPAEIKLQADGGNDRRGEQHLAAAYAQQWPAQLPQAGRFEFQADKKQHQHHAEFGHMHHAVGLAHHIEQVGADDDTGNQITQYRAHTEPFGGRHRDDSCREKNKGIKQQSIGHGRLSSRSVR